MKISINTDHQHIETEVIINCQNLNPNIERLISLIRIMDQQLTGNKNGETHILDTEDVMYAETVDKRLFIYTSDGVYESNLKLYELEERLDHLGFLRINKSSIVHLAHVKSLKSDLNRKIRLTLNNGEKMIVSRQYADAFKERLGL